MLSTIKEKSNERIETKQKHRTKNNRIDILRRARIFPAL